jgi:hypothetical protein
MIILSMFQKLMGFFQEFGIGMDNKIIKTIIYTIKLQQQSAVSSRRKLSMHHPAPQQQHHPRHSNGAHHLEGQQQRRPSLQQAQSPGGLGGGSGLGLNGRGKGNLTFDRILNRMIYKRIGRLGQG